MNTDNMGYEVGDTIYLFKHTGKTSVTVATVTHFTKTGRIGVKTTRGGSKYSFIRGSQVGGGWYSLYIYPKNEQEALYERVHEAQMARERQETFTSALDELRILKLDSDKSRILAKLTEIGDLVATYGKDKPDENTNV